MVETIAEGWYIASLVSLGETNVQKDRVMQASRAVSETPQWAKDYGIYLHSTVRIVAERITGTVVGFDPDRPYAIVEKPTGIGRSYQCPYAPIELAPSR